MKKKKYNDVKIDKGFELIYWNLSYRRKFVRTLWMTPFTILAIILMWMTSKSILITSIISVVTLVVVIAQAIYTYKKWKHTDKVELTKCE